MSVGAAQTPAPPRVFRELLDRFDPHVIDVRGRSARIRLAVTDGDSWDVLIRGEHAWLEPPLEELEPDALLSADGATWKRVARDLRGGMDAFRRGRLSVRSNLNLGVGLLAATSGITDPGRLRFESVKTPAGSISTMQAGTGHPVVALHGLGGTKASFLPTVAALADQYRVHSIDLPGFGDSVKPLRAAYDPHFFARAVCGFMDACGIERAHLIGNSMGGRVAFEVGFRNPARVGRIVGLAPSLAWLRGRPWTPLVKALRPELGLIQITPRPVIEEVVRRFVPGGRDGWSAVGVDEFLRAYMQPRGRAAFYAALRNIYLDEPEGAEGFWTRLRELQHESLFVWGQKDRLVPIAFARHVREALPGAQHFELPCGHVPQLEAPRETHEAVRRFLAAAG